MAAARGVRADEPPARPLLAIGGQLDLFPTVSSAIAGNFGLAPQVWAGIDHLRVRFVGARLAPPDALAFADPGFRHPTTTVMAAIIDYTFGPRFDGWWVGFGFEQWLRTIEHDGVAGKARWASIIGTAGGGYILRLAGDFYLDAWAALHATLNPEPVTVGTFEYKPPALQPSGSIKLGYFFTL